MRKAKKIITNVMAMMMVFSMAFTMCLSAAAATSIKAEKADGDGDRTYDAYQIFSGTATDKTEDDGTVTTILTEIQWGTGVDQTKTTEILAALKNLEDAEGNKYFAAASTAADVADVLVKNPAIVYDFAKIMDDYLSTTKTAIATTDETATTVAAGYYLLKDTTTGADSKSFNIMEVVGSVTVKAKADKPTLVKKILENGEKVDANTANIGDDVEYVIDATIPKMEGYNKYFFIVTDTLDAGLTFDASTFTVKMGETALSATDDYTMTSSTNADTGITTIKVVFKDFLEKHKNDAGKKITIDYKAKLNDKAVVAVTTDDKGNQNKAKLTYSNNPNFDYQGKPGSEDEPNDDNDGDGDNDDDDDTDNTTDTPDDVVVTFTTQIVVDKYDGGDNSKLAGVEFQLLDENKAAIDGRPAVVTDSNGAIIFKGVKEGTYYIKEVEALPGYNKLPNEIKVVVSKGTATVDPVSCTWTYDGVNGTTYTDAVVSIANNKGATLPSTGGIGTVIFYVLGSIFVFGAVVLVITRKRMSYQDEK